MEVSLFNQIIKEPSFFDYKKMRYKYKNDFENFLEILSAFYYQPLLLPDFTGNQMVMIQNTDLIHIRSKIPKLLLQNHKDAYGIQAAEDEIIATSAIENIDFNRESVRRILMGAAPADDQEERITGMKKGLEFIANPKNDINETNLHHLYLTAINGCLDETSRLKENHLYRHDTVFIVGDQIEHCGLDWHEIPDYMNTLFQYIHADDETEDLIKAAVIHFTLSYIHPWFDGNGRMARLLHLWFLIQKGYQSTLFFPFSSFIAKNKKAYYQAFSQIEDNQSISGVIDVTPFIAYFAKNIYNPIAEASISFQGDPIFDKALAAGKLTEKETQLWRFVLSCYAEKPFSTKELEKDFSNAAYATIRNFVRKFSDLGLLTCYQYSNRPKYQITKHTIQQYSGASK